MVLGALIIDGMSQEGVLRDTALCLFSHLAMGHCLAYLLSYNLGNFVLAIPSKRTGDIVCKFANWFKFVITWLSSLFIVHSTLIGTFVVSFTF